MPIYEYLCEKCGNVTERMESITEENHDKSCPDCGGAAHRIISNSSFQLKGSGWYSTDYKKPAAPKCPSAGEKSACSDCSVAK